MEEKKKEIQFLKQKIKAMKTIHESEIYKEKKDWRQLYNSWLHLHEIITKENLFGTKYFCSCSECAINVFVKSNYDYSDAYFIVDKKHFCDCPDARILPIEIFYKWFPNEEQELPVYDDD